MALRDQKNSSLHDKVINEVINVLNKKQYDVYINPGQQKNAGINGNYPDVVMTNKETKTVKFILEVETTDSVTQYEAETQWKKYASEIKATFYLIVPESLAFKARELCQKNGINAMLATYSTNSSLGKITFKFK